MINRIAHMYFTRTDDRGGEIPVAASARRPVTMPTASAQHPTHRRQSDRHAPASDAARRREAIAAALEASIAAQAT
jgi:hypothetical protein